MSCIVTEKKEGGYINAGLPKKRHRNFFCLNTRDMINSTQSIEDY